MNQTQVDQSKYLSYVLRHHPDTINLYLRHDGYARTDELLAKANRNYNLDLATLVKIVAEDDKNRFQFNEDMTLIRATQGHSIDGLDLGFAEVVPPSELFHGTSYSAFLQITKAGITKQQRHHVHLSVDIDTASKVGKRHKPTGIVKGVILRIDALRMHKDGLKFWISENGVYLTEYVDFKYVFGIQLVTLNRPSVHCSLEQAVTFDTGAVESRQVDSCQGNQT
jgi:putative RNA 2'-phosphotransferase